MPPENALFPGVTLDPGDSPVRLGLIALSTDLTTERDAARLLPHGRVALHTTRVAYANPTTPANLRAMRPRIADAARLLVPEQRLAAICYSCTAASIVLGDDAVEAAIAEVRPGIPVVTPGRAGVEALRALGARRIALLTPYLEETAAPVAAYFEAAGFEITGATCLGLADDRDIARVSARTILIAAAEVDTPRADALFVSCTALPAAALVGRLEAALGKPVVTSNLASLRALLFHAGLRLPRRAGRLAAL